MSLPEPYYQSCGVTIYNADCSEVLPYLETADAVITDPPYGIGADNQKQILSRGKLATPRDYGDTNWDNAVPGRQLLDLVIDSARQAIIWGGNYFGLPASSCWLVWDKDNGSNDFADCELAWTNLDKAVRKFRWRWNGMLQEHGGDRKERRYHPTQKPVALMKWCLSQVPEAVTVIDPFMGSGTTLIAAKQCGLNAIGIESHEPYCSHAVERLRQGVLPLTYS